MFSLPWKYRFAISDDISILTFGFQSMSSVHSQCRLPSSPDRDARMFTTRSTSGNSNRCGTSASRSFGPMSGSSLIAEKIQSMMVRNSFGDENSAPMAQDEDPDEPVDRDRVERVPDDRVPDDRVPLDRVLVAGFFAAGLAAVLR